MTNFSPIEISFEHYTDGYLYTSSTHHKSQKDPEL